MPRNRVTTTFAATALFTTLLGAGPLHADVIYDNTTTFTGARSFTQLWIGDEINAAGTDRTVTMLHIGVSMQGFEGTADLEARLYANDGDGGQPGTLLWESDLFTDIPLSGDDDLIPFEVPSIEVPDTFSWMIRISNTDPVAAGLPHYHPPAIGSSPDHAWFGRGDGSAWTLLTNSGRPVNFMSIVETGGDEPLELGIEASCPNGGAAIVSWTGATPDGVIAILFSPRAGSFTIPDGFPCAGTTLDLRARGIRIAFQGSSDAGGSGLVEGNIPGVACGAVLQLIDVPTCEISNVAIID